MYKVDTPTNSLHSLQEVSFSSLGFTERGNLQEWLAQNPQALTRDNDDELLIIQKEFAGFDDTKERLDLLAIDKKGNLVIIEKRSNMPGIAPTCVKSKFCRSSSFIWINTTQRKIARRQRCLLNSSNMKRWMKP